MTAQQLRIAVDVREWARETSTGIGRFLTGLLEWGAEKTGHRWLLLGDGRTEQRVGGPTIEFSRHPERRRIVWDQVTLPRLLRRQRADLFLSPYYKVPLRAPCPRVATIHDLIPLHYPRPGEGGLRRIVTRGWMKLLSGHARQIITDSDHARDDIAATLSISPQRIEVIPLRIEPRFARPPPADEVEQGLEKLGLEPGYVLYVGRYDRHKNVGRLLHAWRSLSDELRRRHPLVLAGKGGAAHPAGAAGVSAPGFVADTELPSLYAGAAVFAFPSRYEGFGLPPLEAMGCGAPVVCSDAASLPEVVGDAALLVAPDDAEGWATALRRVLTDDRTRRRLIAAGKQRAALYRTEATVPRLVALLEAAAGKPGGGR